MHIFMFHMEFALARKNSFAAISHHTDEAQVVSFMQQSNHMKERHPAPRPKAIATPLRRPRLRSPL